MHRASNRLIYGFSFYLDAMATNWNGLILNDYEAVMPLTWRKKWHIKYLYQPAFMQQAGIYSSTKLSHEMTHAFLGVAATKFRFAEIMLNYANDVRDLSPTFVCTQRSNYVLNLEDYQVVFKNYKNDLKKNLRRLQKFQLRYVKSSDHGLIIKLFKTLYSKQLPSFLDDDYKNFHSVCDILSKEHRLITRLVLDKEGQIVAALVLVKDEKRLYNLLSCITDTGRSYMANDFLYDQIVQEFAGQGLLLDLEGSDVPGIADFYKKLGPTLQSYPFIKYNVLHPALKIFKK